MLPRTRVQSDNSIAATDYGTLAHYWKETGITDPPWASPRDVDLLERKLLATGVRRESYWPDGGGTHEETYALNLMTLELRRPPPGVDRDEWKSQFYGDPQWMTGTSDWTARRCKTPFGVIPWVDDLKTGRWPVKPTTPQLTSYVLFDWIEHGQHPAAKYARSITQWPKYPLAGLPVRKWAPPLTALDLEEHLDSLRYSVEHPEEVNPTDEQCRFCDSRQVCPAWNLNG